MKKMTLAALMLAAAPLAQAAPLVDVYAGANYWHPDTSGTIASGDGDIDMHQDLGYSHSNQNNVYVGLEQPLPLLPNVRVSYMDLSDSASNTIVKPIVFDNHAFTGNVHSSYDLKMLDGTLYWSPLNNWVKLDLGLTVRHIKADIKIRGAGQEAEKNVDKTFPLAHVAAEADLPLSGAYVGASVDGVSYDGSHLLDYDAHVGWRSDALLGIRAGYRRMELKLNDVGGVDSDLKIGGPYVGLTLNF